MQVSHHSVNPSLQLHRPSPSPSLSPHQQMIATQQFNSAYWPNMGQEFLSALPRNIQQHKRGSSGSSVASAGPASPHQTNSYHPRIVNSEADYSPSRYDFEYPQQAKTYLQDPIMFGQQYGGMDMRRGQSDDRTSYGPQSVSTMSHHNSPATPQTWDDAYDNNFSAAYQQSLQDVFPEQVPQYKVNNMNNHRHTLQEMVSKSSQQHLRTSSPTSNPRERSPFKPTSAQRQMPQLQKQRTSISPKELMLGPEHVDEKPSLFPEQSFNRQPSNFSSMYQFDSSQTVPQQYPFVSQAVSDSTPDFPAHLLSMESTNDEVPSSQSSQQSLQRVESRHEPASRPNVTSDAGTYSCTYHGCPQRFDSPTKLQKHKREGHRQTEVTGATSSALKNSQAGPHRCDRINPSTGKPCNSVFSRPYDLTRHEDTIHNARKLKVRCHLCTEEKTFSRNDALTRHMRVVHPDVDWVGKQKKRSIK